MHTPPDAYIEKPTKYTGNIDTDPPCREAFEQLKKATQKIIKTVGSSTPEDKYGPTGSDTGGTPPAERQHFVPADQHFYYKVDFWNKEDATAPACDVFVNDQLDTDFDRNTFRFEEVGFLRWTVELEPCQYFNINIDTRPDMDLIVNVEGIFDTNTGNVSWTFHSLDPATMEIPDDPMAGFLPPITESGYEIGWVCLSVDPVSGLADGTTIENQAFVNFDGVGPYNPAPKEGPWTNTIGEPGSNDGGNGGGSNGGSGSGSGGGGGLNYIGDVINEQGTIVLDTTASSDDQMIQLSIKKGVMALNKMGQPITTIRIRKMSPPPAPPEDSHVIGLAYTLEPSSSTFDPPITVTFIYDPDDLSAGFNETDLAIAFYDTSTSQWVALENIVVDPSEHTVSGDLSHFTTFALIAYPPPRRLKRRPQCPQPLLLPSHQRYHRQTHQRLQPRALSPR